MKGLLIKDLYLFIKYCKAFIVIIAVFFGVSFFGEENLFYLMYPIILIGITPMTLLSYDERSHWDKYSLCLPYSRAELVSAKYLVGLLLGLAIYILAVVLIGIQMTMRGVFYLNDWLSMVFVLLILVLLFPTLILPMVFRFGVTKARIIY